MDGSFRYGAHLLILVLSGSQLLIIKPDEERENNWTKVLEDIGDRRKVSPQFSDCVKGAQALLQYARIRAIK
jgi:hypothetical protein